MTIQQVIITWKLNKQVLSNKMGMPSGTFRHKFNETNDKYRFTQFEIEQLKEVLKGLSVDIEMINTIE